MHEVIFLEEYIARWLLNLDSGLVLWLYNQNKYGHERLIYTCYKLYYTANLAGIYN